MGFGYWVIEEKGSGDFVGEIGLADFKRDIAPAMQGSPEIGFVLLPRFHGQGYGTEAARAVLAWADAHLHFTRTVCLIDPQNAASLRVAQKIGYELFDSGVYHGRTAFFLSRTALQSKTCC